MNSFAIAFLFIVQLAFGLVIAWSWSSLRRKQAEFELRLAESIDDQDLAAFSDTVKELVADLHTASNESVTRLEETREPLDRLVKRAEAVEKRLSRRIQTAEDGQEKMDKKIGNAIARAFREAGPGPKDKVVKNTRVPAFHIEPGASTDAVAAAVMQVLAGQAAQVDKELQSGHAELDNGAVFAAQPIRRPKPAVQVATKVEGGIPREQIWKMAEEGLDSYQIADSTGLLPGEIELILNLRPVRRGA